MNFYILQIGIVSHEIVYDQNNDVLIIRNFLSNHEQNILHTMITNSADIAQHYGKDSNSYDLDVKNVPVDQQVQKIIMDKKQLFVDELKKRLNKLSRSIIKRLTFSYDSIVCVRYENTIKNWKHKKRTYDDDSNLMDIHKDEWSTDNMTVSLGHSAKFTYMDKIDKSNHQIIVKTGDLMSFDGDSMYHSVDTYANDAPEWFKYDEDGNIYRYNIQFTKIKPRHSKRLKHMNPDDEEDFEIKNRTNDDNEQVMIIKKQTEILDATLINCQALMLLNTQISDPTLNTTNPTDRYVGKIKKITDELESFMKDVSRGLNKDQIIKVIEEEQNNLDMMNAGDYIDSKRLDHLNQYLKSI